jgi:hypothetical protein
MLSYCILYNTVGLRGGGGRGLALGDSILQRALGMEMAQRLRALTALPKVLSSNPSNHMVAHNQI